MTMQDAWSALRLLETEPAARRYLSHCYQTRGLPHPDRLAFHQSTRFLYTWQQARQFYETAHGASLSVRPLLLFYGYVHLLKGWLITRDPDYPQNSRVLQHGVTTRKRKRGAYHLLEDEVRPQKEGLFAHLARLFGPTPLQDRYSLDELFASLSELGGPYAAVTGRKSPWVRVGLDIAQRHDDKQGTVFRVTFPAGSDGPLAYSPETFRQYVRRLAPDGCDAFLFQWVDGTGKEAVVPSTALSEWERHPLFSFHHGSLYFWNGTPETLPLPIWASHYLILYVLSMLCRYETEWWGELALSPAYAERYLVECFLDSHAHTLPTVILKQMKKNNPLFCE
jgi:hypothetical protein